MSVIYIVTGSIYLVSTNRAKISVHTVHRNSGQRAAQDAAPQQQRRRLHPFGVNAASVPE